MANTDTPKTAAAPPRLLWFSIVKALAILAVLLFHYAAIKNQVQWLSPAGFGPSLAEGWTFARGVTNNAAAAVLYLFAGLCYQGVHVFIAASGFGLALSDARRRSPQPYAEFLKRRALRLLPPYWVVVVSLALLGLVQSLRHWHPGWLIGSSRNDSVVNILLLRDFRERWVWIHPGTYWFVPLIVELYLVYPLLAAWMRRSPGQMLLGCGLITLIYRMVAVFALNGNMVGVHTSSGRSVPLAFFPARLFEFAFGMAAAMWYLQWQAQGRPLPVLKFALGGTILWGLGIFASCYRAGFILCDPLICLGLFPMCCAAGLAIERVGGLREVLDYIGRKSYLLYLMHSLLLTTALEFRPHGSLVFGFVVYCLVSVLLAELLEGVMRFPAWLGRRKTRPETAVREAV